MAVSFYISYLEQQLIVYQKGDIVKDPMKSISFVHKTIPGVGWGVLCRDEVGHVGVGWGGVGHAEVGWGRVGCVMQGWGGSCRGGVG